MTGMDERLAKVAEVLHRERHQGLPCRNPSGCHEADKATEHAAAMEPLLAEWQAEDEARACEFTAHDGTHGPLIRQAKAEALREARDALYRGEGPDMFEDSDIVYGEWLGNRAAALDAGRAE